VFGLAPSARFRSATFFGFCGIAAQFLLIKNQKTSVTWNVMRQFNSNNCFEYLRIKKRKGKTAALKERPVKIKTKWLRRCLFIKLWGKRNI
jgi:hypothetical protein